MKTFKVFENITEVIAWLQIVASPILICTGIGAFIYFRNPDGSDILRFKTRFDSAFYDKKRIKNNYEEIALFP